VTEAPDQIEHASVATAEALPRKRGRPKKEHHAQTALQQSNQSNAFLAALGRIATALEDGNRISSQTVKVLETISIAVDDLGEVL
jgi:hypothetical protein